MFVKVDLAPMPPVVTLEEPDDTKRFHVEVVGGDDLGLVFGALVDAAAGRIELESDGPGVQPDTKPDAWITVDALRRMAKGVVGPDWDEQFDAMLDFARTKGWLDPGGNALRAHVEWPVR